MPAKRNPSPETGIPGDRSWIRPATRIAWTAAAAGAATTIFDVYLLGEEAPWQLLELTFIAGIFTVMAVVSALVIHAGRRWGVWTLILFGHLAFLGASALVSGLGLISLVSILTLTLLIATLTLPPNQSKAALGIALLSGVSAGLMDWLSLPLQLPAPPMLKFFLPILLVLVGLLYGGLIARSFRSFSLRGQLISTFILVSSISVGLITFFTALDSQRILTANANQGLYNAAAQTALRIDNFIQSNLAAIEAEANIPAFSQLLELPPDQRADSQEEALAQQTLLALAQKDSEFITSYALLDRQGIDVADSASGETGQNKSMRDYFYSVMETSAPFVSPVEISRSTNQAVVYFSAPIWSSSGGLQGVLRVRYRADILQRFIEENSGRGGPGSFAFLVDEYQVRLAHGLEPNQRFTTVAPLLEDEFTHLVEARRLPVSREGQRTTGLIALAQALANADTQPYFTGEAGNKLQDEDISLEQSAIFGLTYQPWKVIYSIDRATFLAPIETQTRNTTLLALLIAAAAALAGLGLAQLVATPIQQLTQVAHQITAGDLSAEASVRTGSEIGTLAAAFNAMTRQLRMTLEGLEERVVERTMELERRAVQLRLAAEVGSAVASVRVLDELLPQITRLISERFNYYHIGIFLLDASGEYAVLRAANSEGGHRMLARNHKLKVGEVGIVGYAVANKEARIALDVAQDQVHYRNPDLPETRSELALPLMVGGSVLGALDVQSTQPQAFSTDVIATLQILADQVAVAIEHARLFAENQAALEAAQRAYGQISREAWDRLLRARAEFGYMANRQDAIFPATQMWSPEMEEASLTGEVVQGDDGSVAIPIKDRELVLGVIRLRKPEALPWSKDEVDLADTLARQLFLALEAARLYQETQARAERERLAGEITARMRASNDPQTILQTAVQELRQALKVQRAQVLVQPAAPSLEGDEPEEGNRQ